MGRLLAFAAIAAVPLLLVWIVVSGLRTGIIRGRGGPISRADDPIFFWILIALYIACIGMFVYFIGGIALTAVRSL